VDAVATSIEEAQKTLTATRSTLHRHCVVCGARHPFGLQADFQVTGDHAVEAEFPCGKSYEGYTNVLHGGIVSALLDGAMANCMLAMGLEAYTVDLRIRFRAPVDIGVTALVRGEWLRQEGPLHLLQATILQNGQTKATARAKFLEGNPNAPSHALPTGAPARDLLKQFRKRLH
jgi:uncharacterized protein (TIGR00369 family)